MENYEYVAKTSAGEEVVGVMQADNETAVVRALDKRQLYPISVKSRTAGIKAGAGGRVRLRDVALFYGQLSDLLSAGVPLMRSLETLCKSIRSPRFVGIIQAVRQEVASGETLADAIAKHPQVFTNLQAAMIRAGERAGFLEEVLANISALLDRRDELRNKVRGAMVYPMVLTTFGLAAVLVMLTYFVPKFDKFFSGTTQPLVTELLFGASRLLRGHWAALSALLLISSVGITALLQSAPGRAAWSRWQIRLPVVGVLLRRVSISRFCRILGTMLHNGVPILEALAIAKDATDNAVMADRIATATDSVRAGESLAGPLRGDGMFPDEILEMISVAEESNQLEKVLVQIADTIDRRTARQLDEAIKLIEPLILVVIAGAVGLMAGGLLYPIFNMATQLK